MGFSFLISKLLRNRLLDYEQDHQTRLYYLSEFRKFHWDLFKSRESSRKKLFRGSVSDLVMKTKAAEINDG
jgi:hypothetical protein